MGWPCEFRCLLHPPPGLLYLPGDRRASDRGPVPKHRTLLLLGRRCLSAALLRLRLRLLLLCHVELRLLALVTHYVLDALNPLAPVRITPEGNDSGEVYDKNITRRIPSMAAQF